MTISSASALLQLAGINDSLFDTLLGSSSADSSPLDFAGILDMKTSAISAAGPNATLRDPESAYSMITNINKMEVDFKAQYQELSVMGTSVEHMEGVARQLGDKVDTSTSNADIEAQVQGFVSQYNDWVGRFERDIAPGGILDNVQAAEVSFHELEQNVGNIFNGAAAGVNGLGGLGIEIDPASKRAMLNTDRLESVLASNKTGAVSAIDAFSANFAKSADLLNSADNFIPKQLENRQRAIQYIAENRSSLQAEFGMGDASKPKGDVAKALLAYEQAFDIT